MDDVYNYHDNKNILDTLICHLKNLLQLQRQAQYQANLLLVSKVKLSTKLQHKRKQQLKEERLVCFNYICFYKKQLYKSWMNKKQVQYIYFI